MTPFSDDLEPFPLLRFCQESLAQKRRCFHYSAFIPYHFLCLDISFALFFGAKPVVVVVVAFSNDSIFGVSIENDAFSNVSVFK